MLNKETLDEIVRRIVKVASPTRIILFGSHARGDADEDSDIDLLVVVEETESRRELAIETRTALRGIRYPFDIVVAKEEDVDFYGDTPGTVIHPAISEGVRVYG